MTSTMRRPDTGLSRPVLSIAVVLATIAAGVGVLSATAQGEEIIYGCVHKNSGAIRIVESAADCKENERALSWTVGGTAATVHWGNIDGVPFYVREAIALDVECYECVNSADIMDSGVQADDLGVGIVSTHTLVDESVTTSKLADDSVTSDQLAANSVDSIAIQDGSITSDDLGDDSITSSKIRDGEIFAANLADGSVTEVKLAEDSVTGAKIADGSVHTNDLRATVQTQLGFTQQTLSASFSTVSEVTITTPANLSRTYDQSALHAVMVFGDAKVSCQSTEACIGDLKWNLSVSGVILSEREMRISLSPGEEMMISVHQIAFVATGSQTFTFDALFVSEGITSVAAVGYELTAADLGTK